MSQVTGKANIDLGWYKVLLGTGNRQSVQCVKELLVGNNEVHCAYWQNGVEFSSSQIQLRTYGNLGSRSFFGTML